LFVGLFVPFVRHYIELNMEIDKLEAIEATAQEQYRNSLCIINNGGAV